jgi:hypothetical protein
MENWMRLIEKRWVREKGDPVCRRHELNDIVVGTCCYLIPDVIYKGREFFAGNFQAFCVHVNDMSNSLANGKF